MKNVIILAVIFGLISSCKSSLPSSDSVFATDKTVNETSLPDVSAKNVAKNLVIDTLPKIVHITFQNDSIPLANVKQVQKLRVLNNTSESIVFGEDFILEYYINSAWHNTNNGRQFNNAQYTLTTGREYEIPTDLYFYSSIYRLGKYRISKPYKSAAFRTENQNRETFATYEFTVFTLPMKNVERKVFMELSRNSIMMSELDKPITIKIINNSYDEIFFGDQQHIERFNGKSWSKIPFTGIINSIGYSMYVGTQSSEYILKLRPEQYNYTPGQYRLVKPFSIRNDEGLKSTWKDFTLYSEFLIVR